MVLAGCSPAQLDEVLDPERAAVRARAEAGPAEASDFYEELYRTLSHRARLQEGTTKIQALDSLPKDTTGNVNWTVAVVEGYINPKASLDPNIRDEPPLNLNIFIEAKTTLMANVLFPHSIHTYWLSCKNCHPKIFIPEAGANPISMDEIFKGEWCGRCHGKVAFTFWPRENCTRCHTVLKGQSRDVEHWK